ncbi:hypothetical protein BGP_2138 [Beggiatoa sp. PS]|nr:hypothetical protein BGP_2138 [Beggiatoa sp. PS]
MIHEDGRASLTLGTKSYHGAFSYNITPADEQLAGTDVKLTFIGDANNDDIGDLLIIYPNGATQVVFVLGVESV